MIAQSRQISHQNRHLAPTFNPCADPAERAAAKANKNAVIESLAGRTSCIPEPDVAILTHGLLGVGEGQHLPTQAAALREGLLDHLLLDVANQDLRRKHNKSAFTYRLKTMNIQSCIQLVIGWL